MLGEYPQGSTHEPTKLGLAPSILGTCKQVYAEAIDILYAKNTFYVSIDYTDGIHAWRYALPLNRYIKFGPFSFRNHPATMKIKHWKLVAELIPDHLGNGKQQIDLWEDFCRSIARYPPKSMEIGYEVEKAGDYWGDSAEILDLSLQLLRNIDCVTFRPLFFTEINVSEYSVEDLESNKAYVLLNVEKLTASMTSKETMELAFEMYVPLLRYARAFERGHQYRHFFENNSTIPQNFDLAMPIHERTDCHMLHELMSFLPLEHAMFNAEGTLSRNNVVEFKKQRAAVVRDLETRYRRISFAWAALNEARRRQRGLTTTRNGVEHCIIGYGDFGSQFSYPNLREFSSIHYGKALYIEIMGLVEEYAAAFEPHIPEHIKVAVREKPLYRDLCPSETQQKLNVLRTAYNGAREEKGWDFYHLMREVIDDLDSQFMEIKKARSALLDFDILKEPGFVFDFDLVTTGPSRLIDWAAEIPPYKRKTEIEPEETEPELVAPFEMATSTSGKKGPMLVSVLRKHEAGHRVLLPGRGGE